MGKPEGRTGKSHKSGKVHEARLKLKKPKGSENGIFQGDCSMHLRVHWRQDEGVPPVLESSPHLEWKDKVWHLFIQP